MDNKNLRATDARQRSVLGSGDVKITAGVWSALSFWNASRILTQRGRGINAIEEKMVREMEYSPVALERLKHRDEWSKAILNAIIKKEGSLEFMDGEESMNWPKIKQCEFKHGITISQITSIIIGHREALKKWDKQQTENKKKQKTSKILATRSHTYQAEETDTAPQLRQTQSLTLDALCEAVPESWEELAE